MYRNQSPLPTTQCFPGQDENRNRGIWCGRIGRNLGESQAQRRAELPDLSFYLSMQALNEHSEHLVNLYESAHYVGGHAHTVEFKSKGRSHGKLRSGY
jgi:hypothetical protein